MPGLLFILAHPDDETISAGTIAKYTSAGVPVGLVCATRGERGSTADLCSIDDLPQLREAEVREAGRLLGIEHVEMLPYEDQKLWTAPLDDIRRQLVGAIRRLRPQAVITFDPHGANQHSDHIAISRFVADALPAAADPRWYPETGSAHAVERLLWQFIPPARKKNPTIDLAGQPGTDYLIDITAFRDRKEAAFSAHRTQMPGLHNLFHTEPRLSLETFRIGWGKRPATIPAADLFAL